MSLPSIRTPCCNPDCQNFSFVECDGWEIPTTHSLCESCQREEFITAVATMTKAIGDFRRASKKLNPNWNSYPDDAYIWEGICNVNDIGDALLKDLPNAGDLWRVDDSREVL